MIRTRSILRFFSGDQAAVFSGKQRVRTHTFWSNNTAIQITKYEFVPKKKTQKVTTRKHKDLQRQLKSVNTRRTKKTTPKRKRGPPSHPIPSSMPQKKKNAAICPPGVYIIYQVFCKLQPSLSMLPFVCSQPSRAVLFSSRQRFAPDVGYVKLVPRPTRLPCVSGYCGGGISWCSEPHIV